MHVRAHTHTHTHMGIIHTYIIQTYIHTCIKALTHSHRETDRQTDRDREGTKFLVVTPRCTNTRLFLQREKDAEKH